MVLNAGKGHLADLHLGDGFFAGAGAAQRRQGVEGFAPQRTSVQSLVEKAGKSGDA